MVMSVSKTETQQTEQSRSQADGTKQRRKIHVKATVKEPSYRTEEFRTDEAERDSLRSAGFAKVSCGFFTGWLLPLLH